MAEKAEKTDNVEEIVEVTESGETVARARSAVSESIGVAKEKLSDDRMKNMIERKIIVATLSDCSLTRYWLIKACYSLTILKGTTLTLESLCVGIFTPVNISI